MDNKKRKTLYTLLGVWALIFIVLAAVLVFSGCSRNGNGNRILKTEEAQETLMAEVAGSEIYDLSLYEESSEEYYAALAQLEEEWFPRTVVVIPKGPEGGDYPNAPLPIYDAFPGQQGTRDDGKPYEITRTWIGDIAVGTEVVLEGIVSQGEWCFVTGETIGGWSSSGWVWCYRLFVPE